MNNLTNIIYQYKDKDFDWGTWDCCIFTVKVVEEYKDITLPLWRDVITYDKEKGAMKALIKLGCKSLEDLPSIILNTPKKDISQVKLGYPVYYINEKGIGILGICNGAQSYFLNIEVGLTTRKTEECMCCWSVN